LRLLVSKVREILWSKIPRTRYVIAVQPVKPVCPPDFLRLLPAKDPGEDLGKELSEKAGEPLHVQ
jgi:hypothetical protein